MSNAKGTARRVRVERNTYRRPSDGKFEVGYRDSTGKQRWKVIVGGITAARAERDSILGAKGKGEIVQPNPRLRFDEAGARGRGRSATRSSGRKEKGKSSSRTRACDSMRRRIGGSRIR